MAETLAQVTVKPLFKLPTPPTPSETIQKIASPKETETVHPFAGFAGIIAPAEATAYSAGRLVGLTTPRPPPTLISLTPSEAMKYGPEYAAGTVAGDIMLSIGMGKATEKIWEALPSSVTKPISRAAEKLGKPFRPITQPIAERLEKAFSPPKGIAPGIVDIPEFPKPLPMELAYQQMAWELAEAPKTSAFLVTKYSGGVGGKASAWVTEHWLKQVTGGLSYSLVKLELESVTPITEGSRRGIPYIPDISPTLPSIPVPFFVPKLPPMIERGKPKPPVEKEKEKPSILPDTKSLPDVFPGTEKELIPKPVQKLPAIPKVVPKTMPKTVPKAEQLPASVEPMLQLQIPYKLGKPKVPFKLPTYRRTRAGTMRGFYGWIHLEVPVKGLNLKSLEKLMLGSKSSGSRRRRRK
jgi:hypothetical protein